MGSVRLSAREAKLTFLALRYHLARPGSELDRETKQPAAHGLAEVAEALEPQLEAPAATIELSTYQHERLSSAFAGALNELKAYSLLDRGRRTTVPSFHETLAALFPQVQDEPDDASQLAGELLTLRRRLDREAAASERPGEDAPAAGRPWWRLWRRSE